VGFMFQLCRREQEELAMEDWSVDFQGLKEMSELRLLSTFLLKQEDGSWWKLNAAGIVQQKNVERKQ